MISSFKKFKKKKKTHAPFLLFLFLLDSTRYDNYRDNADACITAMGLSFPPARFVANVTSTASELLRGVCKQLQAKKAGLGLSRYQNQQQSQGGASVNGGAAPLGASSSSAAAAGPAISQEGEVEAGLAKALVFHTGRDVFVIFRGTMSRRDFDHINLVVYPVEAGSFCGAQNGGKVFVVS